MTVYIIRIPTTRTHTATNTPDKKEVEVNTKESTVATVSPIPTP
ncbi:hypothetical protein ACMSEZ_07235 [Bacteroides thetaiotaomicron]